MATEFDFQRAYDSEINISISTFWDGGYDLKLGDGMNGFDATGSVDTWAEVGPWFDAAIREHYPDSDYVSA